MSVRIRLTRVGKKHAPFFRIVAVDSRRKRDGAHLADLGTYDVIKSTVVRLDEDGINHWLSVGAQPSQSVKKIVKEFKQEQKAATPAPKAPKKAKAAAKPAKVEKKADAPEAAPQKEETAKKAEGK